ncbi:hypothetical protein CEXT_642021 [Caerostris extrusa]|uniref:Uncharacterized protein n=1 Tax=Caerostris extrusa TaxID=172846 RepID=A0AAV4Q4U4_CAEEX|nr:hypothetical protein CEXT_642021 [Caerostris extrusa]
MHGLLNNKTVVLEPNTASPSTHKGEMHSKLNFSDVEMVLHGTACKCFTVAVFLNDLFCGEVRHDLYTSSNNPTYSTAILKKKNRRFLKNVKKEKSLEQQQMKFNSFREKRTLVNLTWRKTLVQTPPQTNTSFTQTNPIPKCHPSPLFSFRGDQWREKEEWFWEERRRKMHDLLKNKAVVLEPNTVDLQRIRRKCIVYTTYPSFLQHLSNPPPPPAPNSIEA